MNDTLSIVLTASAWAAGGGLAVWLVTMPLRRRSIVALLASIVLTGTIASVAAVIGSVHAMFLTTNELVVTVTVAIVAGLGAAIAAAAAGRRLTKDNRALRRAVTEVGLGRVPDDDGPKLTSELNDVRRELSATARRLAASRERERALEASRRELVAWVSHDLRTPLAGLRALTEALEDGLVDDPQLSYKRMHADVDRLATMVDDLFELSRIQSGVLAVATERISLDDVVSDCLAALQPLAADQGVQLRGHSDQALAVTGNVRELNRALTNLVANAIRHTPAGGIVDVAVGPATADDDAGTAAVVRVRDECGGIPESDVPRLFDVGFRGEPARTPQAEPVSRAGLGLAITRGIVEAHNGSVDVQNVHGGCEFAVRLPVAA
jgi:signal transduction histidine kinase